jgi:hypothetical protein
MEAMQRRVYLSETQGSASLDMRGIDVATGSEPPVDVTSYVSAFELQEVHEDDPSLEADENGVDIAYIGVASDSRSRAAAGFAFGDSFVYFAVVTHGDWTTQNRAKFTVYIDVNDDGRDDFALFNGWGLLPGPDPSYMLDDIQYSRLVRLSDGVLVEYRLVNGHSPGELDLATFNTNVLFLHASAGALGLSPGASRFSYRVESLAIVDGESHFELLVDRSERHVFDAARPGLDFGMEYPHRDLNGTAMVASYDRQAFEEAGSLGVLCLHHHNTTGDRAHVLAVSASGEPRITGASYSGRSLAVVGVNFDQGAQILIDGRSFATKNDTSSPTTRLLSKKAGQSIAPGATVELRVLKADGGLSGPFTYTRQ